MDNFIFYTPTKVYFGKGQEDNIGLILKSYDVKKVLIHYGGRTIVKSGLLDKVISLLEKEKISYVLLGGVRPNPEIELVYKGIKLARDEGVDFILAIGGGSVLDSAKGIANGLANPDDDVWDYHLGKKKLTKTTRKGAILTLAAAGSEMSNSCVLSNDKERDKRGFGSDLNRFDFAILNPELTFSVNAYQTACGIVDITMHSIERYFSLGEDNESTDRIAEAIIRNTFENGYKVMRKMDDYNLRAYLMWNSSLSHNGLTSGGHKVIMQVHQLEHCLSAFNSDIAHGAGLAALWPSWARYVYKYNFDKFLSYARNVWGIPNDDPEEAILSMITTQEGFYEEIGMPTSLRELGFKEKDLEELALMCSRNKTITIGGYKPLAYEDILNIYKMAYRGY